MVFNSGANKGFWREQLRDRFGKFVKMGGAVTFEISLPGVEGTVTGHGYFIGNSKPGVARIEVRDSKRIPKGIYEVDHKFVTAAKAIIDFDAAKNGTTLKKKISGAEAQKKRMKSVVTLLRGEGRFPIPRQTTTGHWGIDSDIARGAIADYSAVYERLKDQDPSWEQKYKTFEEFWERVKDLSVEGSSQSPNDLSKIPQEMKDINKAYAEEILDLEPDGLITFYRNATNNRLSAAEAARGYVSTNADFAYDYNANAESTTEHNGRYEIDAKPEEVFGMLGYSKLEDEFAVVLGDGVTTQEGRVRKVGELKPPEVAPWLTEANSKIDRGSGSTVFRHFAIGGQYDFYPVDEEMSDLQAMFKKYNFGPADIKNKYDERYGDGSYDKYKASGETVTTGDIKRFFVPLGDGKVGFDPSQFSRYGSFVGGEYGDSSRPETFENDKTDNLLKMFSVLQDLTGQNFMVHKSRSEYEPPIVMDPNLKSEIDGEEALGFIRDEAAVVAEEKGRFPVAGSAEDIAEAARRQYASVFETLKEEYPDLVEQFEDYDAFWKYAIRNIAAGRDTRWAESVQDIDDLMKATNRIYARDVLGLDPNGLITFYRNAINGRIDENIAAAGYVSLDRRMAWNYNSGFGNSGKNGRYTIKAKPDEVNGLLGYSGIQDEHGVVIGPDITAIPGRVERVGDLAWDPVNALIDPKKESSGNSNGGSDFRRFTTASTFDFPVLDSNPFPEGENGSWLDFYKIHGLEQGAIPAKYDEIYGEGSYARDYSGINRAPDYKRVGELFTQKDGKFALDPRKFDGMFPEGSGFVREANDKRDRALKFFEAVQQLSGQRIMTLRHGNNKPEKKPVEQPTVTKFEDIGIDYQPATMDANGERLPTPGAFTGEFQRIMEGAENWKDVAERLRGQTVTYFDFETTGISDYDGDGIKNDPIQLGAVQVKDGKVIKRFNIYMNPGSKLSEWSASNLKRDLVDGDGTSSVLVTPEWLSEQMSPKEGLKQFLEFIGPNALVGGQNVPFDLEILKRMADSAGVELDIAGTIDSKDLASLLPKYDPEKGIDGPKRKDSKTGELAPSSSLGPVANFLGFEPANWHSADGDAEDSFNLTQKIIDRAAEEDSQDKRLLDFAEMAKKYKERMEAFKQVISPDGPVTERQTKALEEFAASGSPSMIKLAKDVLANVTTRGEAAKFLSQLNDMELGAGTPNVEEVVQKQEVLKDFYISDPKTGAPEKVSFMHEQKELAGFTGEYVMITAFLDGKRQIPIGWLQIEPNTGMVKNIEVLDEYQRKGVATELWKYAQAVGVNPKHSPIQTYDGKKWAQGLDKKLAEQKSDAPTVEESTKDWKDVNGVEAKGEESIFNDALTSELFDLSKIEAGVQYAEDVEMFTSEEKKLIKEYTSSGLYKILNRAFRDDRYKNNINMYKKEIEELDTIIKDHGEVSEPVRVFRGATMYRNDGIDWLSAVDDLSVGDIIMDKAYMSTSSNSEIAFGKFGGGVGEKTMANWQSGGITYKSNARSADGSIFWSIDIPVGSTAFAVPDAFGIGDEEDEVILPRGSKFKIKSIRKVQQLDRGVGPREGVYSYYLETELVSTDVQGIIDVVDDKSAEQRLKSSSKEKSKE